MVQNTAISKVDDRAAQQATKTPYTTNMSLHPKPHPAPHTTLTRVLK